MQELYFDISSEKMGGSLYRIKNAGGESSFNYHYSTYDENSDEIKVFKTSYSSFADFWQALVKNKEWFYLHPLFVHPEQRDFVREQLESVDWNIHQDMKWQESHRRQWRKVL